MKIALITDQHFGARSDSAHFHKFFAKFYRESFFPELKKRNIKTLVMLGDTFDRRKYVNYSSFQDAIDYYFAPLCFEFDIKTFVIVGNHDTYFKNTNKVNSENLLLRDKFPNLIIVDNPVTTKIDGIDICLLPWICEDNFEMTQEVIKNTKAEICMGHLEIYGFQMYPGQDYGYAGYSRDMFNKFEQVLTGHFHHKSTDGHIYYLGCPYEMTWQEAGDPKGFHIYDLETRELEFVQNPFTMFSKVEYDDSKGLISVTEEQIKEKYVKIIVTSRKDTLAFEAFMNQIYSFGPYDVKTVEDWSEFNAGEVDETINLEDTLSVLDNYVDSVATDMDKEKIKDYMKKLYTEALAVEV